MPNFAPVNFLYIKCLMLIFIRYAYKFKLMQNRESTEGYSKSIVRKNNDKFGKKEPVVRFPARGLT